MIGFNKICKQILKDCGTSEFKWKEAEKTEKLNAARTILEQLVDEPDIRVLVLSWDTHDSRHTVLKRDDRANFHRMLFHGLRRNADWHRQREWHWYPDEKTDLNHEEVQDYLNACREMKREGKVGHLFEHHREFLWFDRVQQRCSRDVPIIGVADLFAGLVRASITESDHMLKAIRIADERKEKLLFEDFRDDDLGGRPLRARAELGAHLYNLGRDRKKGISLRTKARFTTHNEKGQFLFWHWLPKGPHDKAPIKNARAYIE